MMIRQIKETDLAQVCAIEAATFSDAWTMQSFEETMQNPESCFHAPDTESLHRYIEILKNTIPNAELRGEE